MDPQIEWTEAEGWPLYDGTFVGPQAIVDEVLMRLGEIGDNFSLNVDQLVADGDTVVALGTYNWNRIGSGEPAASAAWQVLAIRHGDPPLIHGRRGGGRLPIHLRATPSSCVPFRYRRVPPGLGARRWAKLRHRRIHRRRQKSTIVR